MEVRVEDHDEGGGSMMSTFNMHLLLNYTYAVHFPTRFGAAVFRCALLGRFFGKCLISLRYSEFVYFFLVNIAKWT